MEREFKGPGKPVLLSGSPTYPGSHLTRVYCMSKADTFETKNMSALQRCPLYRNFAKIECLAVILQKIRKFMLHSKTTVNKGQVTNRFAYSFVWIY